MPNNIFLEKLKFRDFNEIRSLYKSAFPQSERKPFLFLLYQQLNGKADLLVCRNNDVNVGLCFIVKGNGNYILLDYLAVDDKFRNNGYGSEILTMLTEKYSDKGIIVEVENPYTEGADSLIRQRRMLFYERNGIENTNINVVFFNNDFILLCSDGNLTYEKYHSLLLKSFGFTGKFILKKNISLADSRI